MINIPLPEDNLFERLATKSGLGDLIADFGERLKDEPRAIRAAVVAMETSMEHPAAVHVGTWGHPHPRVAEQLLNRSVGVKPDRRLVEVTQMGIKPVITPIPTPEVTAQEEPEAQEAQDAEVIDINKIRARIDAINGMSIEEMKAEIPILAEASPVHFEASSIHAEAA